MVIYPITKNHIVGLPQKPYRNGVGKNEGNVAHSTGDNGATDENEHDFESRTWKNAFAHVFCDWDSITEVANPIYPAYGAGAIANPRYIHIELCQVKNDKSQSALQKFQASYDRYTYAHAYYLFQRKLGVKDGVTLVSHNWVSKNLGGTDHTDPIDYLNSWGISWASFVQSVKGKYDTMATPVKPIIPAIPSAIVNGKRINGILSNEKLYIPIRDVTDALKMSIIWDEKTQTATVK